MTFEGKYTDLTAISNFESMVSCIPATFIVCNIGQPSGIVKAQSPGIT